MREKNNGTSTFQKRSVWICLGVGALCVVGGVCAKADLPPPESCQIYTSDDSKAGGDVREIQTQFRSVFVRVCSTSGAPTKYYVLSTPWKGRLAVCHYHEDRVIEKQQNGHPTWTKPAVDGVEKTEFMALARANCPTVDDGAYIRSGSVPEKTFLELMDFYASFSSSADRFDKAFLRIDTSHGLSRFRSYVLDDKIKAARIYLDTIPPSFAVKRYVLVFVDPNDKSVSYRVIVSSSKEGFFVSKFSAWIA